jgi:hypothetical protein
VRLGPNHQESRTVEPISAMEAGANSEKVSATFKDLSILEGEFLKVEVESSEYVYISMTPFSMLEFL